MFASLRSVFLPVAMAAGFTTAADRPPVDLRPATAEQVLNHHLVRPADLGPLESEDGHVRLTEWLDQESTAPMRAAREPCSISFTR
jgi:hypothetical protein